MVDDTFPEWVRQTGNGFRNITFVRVGRTDGFEKQRGTPLPNQVASVCTPSYAIAIYRKRRHFLKTNDARFFRRHLLWPIPRRVYRSRTVVQCVRTHVTGNVRVVYSEHGDGDRHTGRGGLVTLRHRWRGQRRVTGAADAQGRRRGRDENRQRLGGRGPSVHGAVVQAPAEPAGHRSPEERQVAPTVVRRQTVVQVR